MELGIVGCVDKWHRRRMEEWEGGGSWADEDVIPNATPTGNTELRCSSSTASHPIGSRIFIEMNRLTKQYSMDPDIKGIESMYVCVP